jgi:hypothetical protein
MQQGVAAGFFGKTSRLEHMLETAMTANRFPDRLDAANDIDPSRGERNVRRFSHWMTILYLAVALIAPLAIFSGPDVLSPTAPAIANAALDGHFAIHRSVCADAHAKAAAAHRVMRKAC